MAQDDVKQLQTFLSENTSFLPKGLATGYFGSLTENALKQLQQQYGLPQTGVLDEATRQIIFPCVRVAVVQPNGGETFRVGDTMNISWTVAALQAGGSGTASSSPFMMFLNGNDRENGNAKVRIGVLNPAGIVRPLSPVLSIDLVSAATPTSREQFVFHVRNVSLLGSNTGSIVWKIPQSIPESSQYRIQVSVGKMFKDDGWCETKGRFCVARPMDQMQMPAWGAFDESDGTFSILGGAIVPSVPPIPTGTSSVQALIQMRTQVLTMIQKMQDVLAQINAALQSIGVTF